MAAVALIQPGASQDEVIDAYRTQIDQLMTEQGYVTVDVISLNSDHPQKAELRAKFLDEHRHGEDEVRFFVAGRGLFTLHIGDYVYAVLCEKNDLISVPAGTPHWFDMGEHPPLWLSGCLTTLKVKITFTGEDIASRFPRLNTGGHRMLIKAILTDIEGTTSAVSFVFDVLFPFAAKHLPDFVRDHAEDPEVAVQLGAVRLDSGEPEADASG